MVLRLVGDCLMNNARKFICAAAILIIAFSCWLYYTGTFGPHPRFVKTTFNRLPNWEQDNQAAALNAFKQSCTAILKKDLNLDFHHIPQYGKAKDWQIICLAANQIKNADNMAARKFFESWFEPYQIESNFNSRGLFTGYYLPLLHGSLKRDKQSTIPIYGLPNDLVKVNLGAFHPELGNHMLVGQLKDHALIPYPDRAAILNGSLGKKAPVLVWGKNQLDVFFAQIQGSAIVALPKHKQMMIGYASGNGQPYTAIGKVLVQNNALKKSDVSMQSIRDWLTAHPQQVNEILNQNANYVFFRILKGNQPLGTEQIPVTPERTLAVDTQYIALGAPIWLDTVVPEKVSQSIPFQHLLIAQDTGGAIKGVVRGDVYWGAGEKAAYTAGHMASRGQYWVLLPRHQRE